ncbi:hypothetical protein HK102_003930 [Quaeritorhiza haematococci]|nr:hypothetical protein HK102_003930 [Quaeritorhiza haematococci]
MASDEGGLTLSATATIPQDEPIAHEGHGGVVEDDLGVGGGIVGVEIGFDFNAVDFNEQDLVRGFSAEIAALGAALKKVEFGWRLRLYVDVVVLAPCFEIVGFDLIVVEDYADRLSLFIIVRVKVNFMKGNFRAKGSELEVNKGTRRLGCLRCDSTDHRRPECLQFSKLVSKGDIVLVNRTACLEG